MGFVGDSELAATAVDQLMSSDSVDDKVLDGGVDIAGGDVIKWGDLARPAGRCRGMV